MTDRKICLFYLILLLACSIFAQQNNPNKTKLSEDCNGAIILNVSKSTSYDLSKPPNGFGSIQEIKTTSINDKFAFENEHNSTWYLLNINHDGELVFELIPNDTVSDYDFLLYEYGDSSFCDRMIKGSVKPVRSNLARNDIKIKGYTGLSVKSADNWVGKGINSSYSKSIAVKKGERYMLVTDNLYSNTVSHKIKFNYIRSITISGRVTNFLNEPLEAEIKLLDKNNKEITHIKSDPKTGMYTVSASVNEDVNYTMIFYNNSYLPESQVINTNSFKLKDPPVIDKKMKGLKIGETYDLVYFSPERLVFLTDKEAAPVVALFYAMQQNSKLRVLIEGHTDKYEITKSELSCATCKKSDMEISNERSENVAVMLSKMGISKSRMEKKGMGHERMLIANPKTQEEKDKNKRVSIKILAL